MNLYRDLARAGRPERDYVKAIFDKDGVSSRGELVAKLFAEHCAPAHLQPGGYDAVTG